MYDRGSVLAATDVDRESRVLTGCSNCCSTELRRSITRYLDRVATDARRGGFRVTETVRPDSGAEIPPSDIEEGSTERGHRAPSVIRLLLYWRDWSLPAKLAAVTLVPVVFAIVLGAMQIAGQVDRAGSYRTVDRLVAVNEQLRPLAGAL